VTNSSSINNAAISHRRWLCVAFDFSTVLGKRWWHWQDAGSSRESAGQLASTRRLTARDVSVFFSAISLLGVCVNIMRTRDLQQTKTATDAENTQ